MNTKILIRADGNKDMGMGHLVRASLIAKTLKEEFSYETRIIVKDNEAAKLFLTLRSIEAIFMAEHISVEEEMELLTETIRKEEADMIILDVLENDVNPEYMDAIKNTGIHCVVITDDSHKRIIDADLIWNANPNQKKEDYTNEKNRYVLGAENFIMDQKYSNFEVSEPKEDVETILVTLGGSDHNDLVFKVLGALEQMDRRLKAIIVTSKASGYIDRLEKYLKEINLPTALYTEAQSLIEFWLQCDLAITAGGNTLFERIAARCPGATVCQLKRQMEIADCFERQGVNVNLGYGPDLKEEELSERIKSFIQDKEEHLKQFKNAPSVITGSGLIKFGDEIQTILEGKEDGLRTIKAN